MSSAHPPSRVTFDVVPTEQRNRLTTFFRYFTVLPHAIVLGAWGYAVYAVAAVQWFAIVFTGRRVEGIWSFQRSWLGYASRVNSYSYLAHDVFPNFGAEWGAEPVAFDHGYEASANRLTNGLRLIWAIPAMFVGFVVGIGLLLVTVASWFAILVTGRQPGGMFEFVVRAQRFVLDYTAYVLLMTDVYPRYDSASPVGVLPPGDGASRRPIGAGAPFAPPPHSSLPPPPRPATPSGDPLPPPTA